MLKRRTVGFCFALIAAAVVTIPPAVAQDQPDDGDEAQAAAAVLEQLEAADHEMGLAEITALDQLGPAPWTSLGRHRSPEVMEAWLEVAKQLPASEMVGDAARAAATDTVLVEDNEDPDQTGVNDTPETGRRVRGFGSVPGEARTAIIRGNLSGAEVRPPIDFECPSVEDDGSIPQANPAVPSVVFGAFCGGEIGDGPHGETTGDVDFFSFGEVEAGSLLVLDVFHISGSLEPVEAVVAIYDSAGNLIASAEDSGNPNLPEFLLVENVAAGTYYGVIAGCCELPSDPFDPTSGAGVTETGTYEMFVVAAPPPCISTEDDGSISLANSTNVTLLEIEFCAGLIGDGPHGATTGDIDYFDLGVVEAGQLLIADVVDFFGNPDAPNTVVGIYDSSGTLIASGEDSGDPELPEFLEVPAPETDNYFVAVAGCCELASDPFDPTSGAGVTETGPYEIVLGALEPPPPPCESAEDDGSIPLANDAAATGFGDDELFVSVCLGEIGDGPRADTGDVDFFSTREMEQDKVLVVDFADFVDGPNGPSADMTIGVYDDSGTLLASGQDSPDPSDTNFFEFTVPETAVYHVAITGGLPTDPFDSTSGTNTDIVGPYDAAIIDVTRELLDEIIGGGPGAGWQRPSMIPEAHRMAAARLDSHREATLSKLGARRNAAQAEMAEEEEPVVDVDFYKVRLRSGDVISGGFDSARFAGIIDPSGVARSVSPVNLSFIYPADSPLRHARRTGFDHVVTQSGTHFVFVAEGAGAYEGELHVAPSGRSDEDSTAEQIIFLDFDGAAVSPDIFFGPPGDPTPPQPLSPLASFLPAWGLDASDESDVIDAIVDSVIENLDTDLRIRDRRNGNRDATREPTTFDVEILNSRDHADPWGQPNVSRIVIGGTIDELQIPTVGIAQSIDPGNLDAEETGIVLLDLLSGPDFDPISLNFYSFAGTAGIVDLIGIAVGHIAAHEVGHFIGNWHTEIFNGQVSLMDSGGEFESVFGVGADGILGTADDVDADFAEDIFDTFEGFIGTEDTAGRSVYALSTGKLKPPVATSAFIGDMVETEDGLGVGDVLIELFAARKGNQPQRFLTSTRTNFAGHYGFEVEEGCYRLVIHAPEGRTFVNGDSKRRRATCVDWGETDLSMDGTLTSE